MRYIIAKLFLIRMQHSRRRRRRSSWKCWKKSCPWEFFMECSFKDNCNRSAKSQSCWCQHCRFVTYFYQKYFKARTLRWGNIRPILLSEDWTEGRKNGTLWINTQSKMENRFNGIWCSVYAGKECFNYSLLFGLRVVGKLKLFQLRTVLSNLESIFPI